MAQPIARILLSERAFYQKNQAASTSRIEHRGARGVAMDEVHTGDGAELSIRKESGEWQRTERFGEDAGVVIGHTEKMLAAAAAAEEQRAERRAIAEKCLRALCRARAPRYRREL